MLAKQELFEDQHTGEVRGGKIKGLTLEDLEIVKDNWGAVQKALQGQVLGTLQGGDAEDADDYDPGYGDDAGYDPYQDD